MSANNQLVIVKEICFCCQGYEYCVYENSCVDNEFVPNNDQLLYRSSNLEEAIRWANKYQEDNVVEYGIAFVGI